MAKPLRRRALVAGGVLLAVVAVVVLWLGFNASADERAVARDTPAAPAPTVALAPAVTPSAPAARPVARQIEVCGLGIFDAPTDTYGAPPSVLDRMRASTVLTSAVANLAASARADDRAIALQFQSALAIQQAIDAAEASRPGCTLDQACVTAASETGGQLALPYQIALAQLADQTDDPLALALALRVCTAPQRGNTLCNRITPARLAEHDPDNAMPWLLVADDARRRGDPAAQAEAMRRAAAARRNEPYLHQTLRPLADATLAKAAPIDRYVAQASALGVYAALPLPSYAPVLEYCRRADARERAETCAPLAALLVDGDGSMLDIAMGRAIGAKAGWSAERIAAVDDQFDAMRWVAKQMGEESWQSVEGGTQLSCAAMAMQERLAMDMARYGEGGQLRRRIAATRQPVAVLAKRYRDEEKVRPADKP